jgi:hypothetical protein
VDTWCSAWCPPPVSGNGPESSPPTGSPHLWPQTGAVESQVGGLGTKLSMCEQGFSFRSTTVRGAADWESRAGETQVLMLAVRLLDSTFLEGRTTASGASDACRGILVDEKSLPVGKMATCQVVWIPPLPIRASQAVITLQAVQGAPAASTRGRFAAGSSRAPLHRWETAQQCLPVSLLTTPPVALPSLSGQPSTFRKDRAI